GPAGRPRRAAALALALVVGAAGAAACSSGGDDEEERGADEPAEGEESTVRTRPDGPAATFGGPLEGGNGIWLASAGSGPALEDVGYEEAEYTASGTAVSYTSEGELPADGTYELTLGDEAEFTTRIVVRRPSDPADANGTVVMEWLNVSSGADANPDYTYLAAELVRSGTTWVGVSAQRIGVEGGDVAVAVPGSEGLGLGQGLRNQDPERYGDLTHPGDAFAYDIFTQVGRGLLAPGDPDPLGGIEVERLLAVGESQSGFTLTTYVNGVQPLTQLFDGFLIHSRGGAAAPLGEPGKGIGISDAIFGTPTTIRTDGDAPVIVVQTETDLLGVLGYLPARQDDTERFRLWEIAGTAHADRFQVGPVEDMLGCSQPINRGQQVYVVRAALRALDRWVADGTPAPEAPRLDVDESGGAPAFVLDDNGMATGGIRTPMVEAPLDTLTGAAPEGSSVICLLMGATTPLPAERLAELYPSVDDYTERYEAATDAMIEAGFAVPEDREEILADADPDRLAAALGGA
ncbi:MAG TPA: alpha/beta hydrolase domain-containing protein, partial [Acidimicrobiales bacterium]